MSERVLIIDDDERLAAMLADYLKPRGFDSEVAPDAKRGLARLARVSYDAVVLEVEREWAGLAGPRSGGGRPRPAEVQVCGGQRADEP